MPLDPVDYHGEDEFFLCWDGTLRIELNGRESVVLNAGGIFVAPRGLMQRPVCDGTAHAS
ncbi:hypothetical protein [Saccharopolyspora spinosa]|uniref:hypothetical protein n=1 Tax=Saccharopolyspora spinosa TaxID=60894 RepID=UPI0007C5D901|nr:hypothetical protein [Saccharopolyspora spinosa]